MSWLAWFGAWSVVIYSLSTWHIQLGHTRTPVDAGYEELDTTNEDAEQVVKFKNIGDVVKFLDRTVPEESKRNILRYYFLSFEEVRRLEGIEQEQVRVWGSHSLVAGGTEDWEGSRIARWLAWRGFQDREAALWEISRAFARHLQGKPLESYCGDRAVVIGQLALFLTLITFCFGYLWRVMSRSS